MDAARVSAEFSSELHPHAPAGSSTGGQFTKSGGSGSTSQTTKSRRPAPHSQQKRRRRTIPHGQLGFDGQYGTGYGMVHGDPRVKALQQELNRLGLLDMHGRKLVIDGKLGPLTTSSIRAAQRRLGMRATGIIAPAFIDRLKATKTLPPAKKAAPHKPRHHRKPVHAKFDPSELRNPDGTWTESPVGALKDGLKLAGRIQLDNGERLAGSGRLNLDSPTGMDVLWAAVDSPDGREYRIGTIPNEDVGKWRAAEKGATVALSSESASRLVDDLSSAESKAVDLANEAEAIYSAGDTPSDPVLRGDAAVAEGTVDSPWGPIDWSVYLDDGEPTSWVTDFQAGGDARMDRLQLDADGLTKLIDGLDRVISQPVTAAAAEPYGDVEYADPGYQPDGKKRYPLMDAAHCRNAWSRINDPDNAAKYTADQLAKVKAKILAAGRKYGIEFADDSKKVAAASPGDLFGVELARPGPWATKTGQKAFSAQDLKDAADFFAASGGQAVPVKLGHDDGRFDGQPSFGSVTNVRYTEDDRGPVLLGDIVDMPSWLAASAPKRWPNRSIEGWQNFTYDGREYSLILSGLAFLGVTPPAMRNIRSLTDLQNAIAASSAQRVFASAPIDDQAAQPQTSAPVAVEEGAGPMDPAKIREALGLSADAPDDEVGSALTVAAATLTGGDPAPAPVQASLFGDDPAPAPAPQKAAPIPAGMMLVSASAWQQREDAIKGLTDFMAQSKRNERDDYLAKAVQAGKFTPAQKPHFSAMWDGNPDATRQYIDSMTPNTALAVMASGYAGSVDTDEVEREYQALVAGAPKWGH